MIVDADDDGDVGRLFFLFRALTAGAVEGRLHGLGVGLDETLLAARVAVANAHRRGAVLLEALVYAAMPCEKRFYADDFLRSIFILLPAKRARSSNCAFNAVYL